MARPIRINFEGAYYHVVNRGRGRMNIFRNHRDYKDFLRLMAECCDQYQVSVVAYCLMSNHYHLLLHTPHANLSAYMRQLNGVYTQAFNRRYRQDGSLFRGRYKAVIVQEEFYLMRVIRYIHLNPKKAEIVRKPEDYEWASHKEYLKVNRSKRWLNYQDVMKRKWGKEKKGLKGYEAFMGQEHDREVEEFYKAKKVGCVLGENDYKDQLAHNYIHKKRYYNREIPERRKIEQKYLVEQIEEIIKAEYNLSEEELRNARRGEENEARNLAIRLIREKVGVSCKEIAQRYGVGNERSISEYCRRVKLKCQRDERFAQGYRKLEKLSLQVET